MTNIPFIYQYEEKENERAAAGYSTFGYLITRIEETLYDQYGVFYELYASDDPNTGILGASCRRCPQRFIGA